MKLFIDSADYRKIAEYAPIGLIDGVTINPSLLKIQQEQPLHIVREIIKALPDAEISLQVTETEPKKLYEQAQYINNLADNMVVKIPCCSEYLPVIAQLIAHDIPVNATVVFSLAQAFEMAKLGVTYISVFLGRLEDNGVDGLAVVSSVQHMLDTYDFDSELLVASVRSKDHVEQAISLGVDAITVPCTIFEQLIESPYTQATIEAFRQDWVQGPHSQLLE